MSDLSSLVFSDLPADNETIYEDVQRTDDATGMYNNGWSSSEFESYDEHSDTEVKRPARSKVKTLSFNLIN